MLYDALGVFILTQNQYRHEVMQAAILAHGKTADEAERMRISKEIASMVNHFWTDERALDYINYAVAPNGTICPECKDTNY